jgi:hypothetical protein
MQCSKGVFIGWNSLVPSFINTVLKSLYLSPESLIYEFRLNPWRSERGNE